MRATVYRFCGCVIAMPVAAWLLPGVMTENAQVAWFAGLLLAAIYLVLRPLIKLVLSPFNCLTFGLVGFVADALLVQLAANWMPGFHVESFLWALLTALLAMALSEGAGRLAERE